MFVDADEISEGTIVESDICIVGGGAAGITLAREFIGTPTRVCLIESGGFEYDAAIQQLYQGENVGRQLYELHLSRLRYFGGSTNEWAGYCRPLKPIDFEQRPWLPHSGWPFGLGELEPFYRRAQQVCQLGSYCYDGSILEAQTGKPVLPFDARQIVTEIVQRSPPTRFANVYRAEINAAANVLVYLHANAINIESGSTPSAVTRLHVATLGGKRISIAARRYILAAGGIENARLLLVSNERQTAGLGNQHDLVGRFFMEHPMPVVGQLYPADERWSAYCADLYEQKHKPVSGVLSLAKSLQEEEQILDCVIGFEAVQWGTDGWNALERIAHRHGNGPTEIGPNLWAIISDLKGIAKSAYQKVMHEQVAIGMFNVQCFSEQAPNPDSRVTLGEKRDKLGLPQPELDLRLAEIDQRTISRTLQIFDQELRKTDLGRTQAHFGDWPSQFVTGNHQMGTTRMSADAQHGVVDANCRVYGMENLYVAGSSVFPTSGSANPTLTIVALALRLADHIKQSTGGATVR